MKKKVKVVELFAGVGGFRLGLEKSNFEVIWSLKTLLFFKIELILDEFIVKETA